jgi:hypothetical protein
MHVSLETCLDTAWRSSKPQLNTHKDIAAIESNKVRPKSAEQFSSAV